MLFALGSPGFIGMAMSYFSMTAHLFMNALFVWLLLERTPRRLVAAGAVGSFALVLSNPVPHLLFALPWVASIARGADGRRNFLRVAVGYAPLALLLGLGWWLFLRDLQGKTPMSMHAADDEPLYRLANLAWSMFLELWKVFGLWEGALGSRLLEQARLWSWSVPGLPLLAIAGWWLSREVREARLLALVPALHRARLPAGDLRPGVRLGRALRAPGIERAAGARRARHGARERPRFAELRGARGAAQPRLPQRAAPVPDQCLHARAARGAPAVRERRAPDRVHSRRTRCTTRRTSCRTIRSCASR